MDAGVMAGDAFADPAAIATMDLAVGGVALRGDDDGVHLDAGAVRLLLDLRDGALREVGDRQGTLADAGAASRARAGHVVAEIGGRPSPVPSPARVDYSPGMRGVAIRNAERRSGARLTGLAWDAAGGVVTVRVETADGDVRFTDEYRLQPGVGAVARRGTVRAAPSAGQVPLRAVELTVPAWQLAPGDLLAAPGLPLSPDTPARELPQGRLTTALQAQHGNDGLFHLRTDFGSGCIGLRRAGGRTLLTLAHAVDELALVDADRDGQDVTLSDRFECAAWLSAGREITTGWQLLAVGGTVDDALDALRTWHASIGLVAGPPDRTPPAIFEAHLGHKFLDPFRPDDDETYAPYPDVEHLRVDLPRIAGLGFDTLQLMPRFPFPAYTVHDYRDVGLQYAAPAALRRMVDEAHDLGLRVLLDVVCHGVADASVPPWQQLAPGPSPYLSAHPEWFARDEDGEVARTFTLAFDNAHPGWQRELIDALCGYVREIGVDGFRIDAPTWNNFPNWQPAAARRPGESAAAAWRLFRCVRDELAAHGGALLFTEPNGPVAHTAFDLTYSYDEMWLLAALVPPRAAAYGQTPVPFPARITAAQARRWLAEKQRVYPDGAFERVVRQIDSHDSFEWEGLGQFRYESLGREASRALFAVNALLPGGIMNYVGGEAGQEPFYRRVLELRRAVLGPLAVADFDASVCEDDAIFHVVVRGVGHDLLLVVNVSEELRACEVLVPGSGSLRAEALLCEEAEFAGRTAVAEGAGLRYALRPFGVVVCATRDGAPA